ncbi:MAG: hypothetical protein AB7T86_01105 [Xanthobacteraceae bacterium]|uniref:hypothetical protein n=1 Tax=Pseudolabrys sp. TaxID=1960880 RepID=UPI003D0D2335
MRILIPALLVVALASPALADNYPVSGRWGENRSGDPDKGAIDCNGRRVVGFNGNQRTDSKGGVPAYRNISVRPYADGWRIVDEFTTGQISGGRTNITLRKSGNDRIELSLQGGSTLKLQRCK